MSIPNRENKKKFKIQTVKMQSHEEEKKWRLYQIGKIQNKRRRRSINVKKQIMKIQIRQGTKL